MTSRDGPLEGQGIRYALLALRAAFGVLSWRWVFLEIQAQVDGHGPEVEDAADRYTFLEC